MPATFIRRSLQRIRRIDRGAALTEYGLLVLFVAAALVLALAFFGDEVVALFSGAADEFEARPPPPPPD